MKHRSPLGLLRPLALFALTSACATQHYDIAGLSTPGAALRVPVTLGPRVAIGEEPCVTRSREVESAHSMRETATWSGTSRTDEVDEEEIATLGDGFAVRDVVLDVSTGYSGAQTWVPTTPRQQGTAVAFLSTLVGALAGRSTSSVFAASLDLHGRLVGVAPRSVCLARRTP